MLERSDELLALDEAIDRLAAMDPQLAKLVELRFFGGMTFEETGRVLGVVSRDYQVITNARAVELAREVAARAFPKVTASEWQLGRAVGQPGRLLPLHREVRGPRLDLDVASHVRDLSPASRRAP